MTNETHMQPILKVWEKEARDLGEALRYEQHQKKKRRLSTVIHRAQNKKALSSQQWCGEEIEHADRRRNSN